MGGWRKWITVLCRCPSFPLTVLGRAQQTNSGKISHLHAAAVRADDISESPGTQSGRTGWTGEARSFMLNVETSLQKCGPSYYTIYNKNGWYSNGEKHATARIHLDSESRIRPPMVSWLNRTPVERDVSCFPGLWQCKFWTKKLYSALQVGLLQHFLHTSKTPEW